MITILDKLETINDSDDKVDVVHANAGSFDIDDGVEGDSEFLRDNLSSHPTASSITEARHQAPLKRVKARGVKDFMTSILFDIYIYLHVNFTGPYFSTAHPPN